MAKRKTERQAWLVVKLDVDILYWYELTKEWIVSDALASKYPRRIEADTKAIFLASENPDLIGKLHIKNFYENGFSEFEQGELF